MCCILNVQRFCLHDGPGIRTTVFLKGCPLSCLWCHNPESQTDRPELLFDKQKCLRCGSCRTACPQGAIPPDGAWITVNRAVCLCCGQCQDACPSGALQVLGEYRRAEDVLAEILQDRVFYETSGGGVTISGGEPLLAPRFVTALLALCKAHGVHTAIDTSGFAPLDVFWAIMPHTDMFLYDIKHMDNDEHLRLTGVGNELVLANLHALSRLHKNVVLRVPLVPGLNDDPQHLRQIRALALELGVTSINLLPYHPFARGKYERMLLPHSIADLRSPTEAELCQAFGAMSHPNLRVTIGG